MFQPYLCKHKLKINGLWQIKRKWYWYYTIKQLAEKWGVSIATIWRHEKLGHIKGQRIGRRVLFPKEQIDRIKSLKATNRDADKNSNR